MLDIDNLKSILESILFASDKATSAASLAELLEVDIELVQKTLQQLKEEFEQTNRGFQLRSIAGKWSLYTNPANHQFVEQYIVSGDFRRLTQAALETLSIIAYKQPVTKQYINDIRGVNSDGSVSTLLQKGLIKDRGRAKSPGGPIIYGTTRRFLEQMSLNSVKDMPGLREFAPDEETKEQIKESFFEKDTGIEMDELIPTDN